MAPTVNTETEFSIAVLPDTQHYARLDNGIFEGITDWIATNQSEYNIQMVLHEGDLVQNRDDEPEEWDIAETAIGNLDGANVPNLLALGNHDANDIRNPTTYRERFPASRYGEMVSNDSSIVDSGTYEGYPENAYLLQEINGEQYLYITLEFGPRQVVLDWCDTVLSDNPDALAVLVTHTYIFSDGTRTDSDDSHAPGTYSIGDDHHNGEQMWDEMVRSQPNLRATLSGHHLGSPYAAHRTDDTDTGDPVHQMYVNYQDMTDNGGNGWFRLLVVDTGTNDVRIRTYSSELDEWSTASNEAFDINLENTLADAYDWYGNLTIGPYTSDSETVAIDGDDWADASARPGVVLEDGGIRLKPRDQ